MAVGRTTEGRTASVTTSLSSATITAGAGTFGASDVGRKITATGIPANATITAVASGTSATISAAATAAGTVAATLAEHAYGTAPGFYGWSPETDTEASAYSVAANNAGTVPPDRITNRFTGVSQRGRG